MISRVFTATTIGINGKLIEVECDTSNGLPSLVIVGLGNKAIDEAKERVRSAIKNTKLDFPKKRITINLAPANIPKEGSHFDLPIALALLAVSGQVPAESLNDTLVAGELALDGSIRSARGIISLVEAAKLSGLKQAIVPANNSEQASLIEGIKILPAKSLKEVFEHLTKVSQIKPAERKGLIISSSLADPMSEIKGQEQAKRALLIAAAGGHNLLLSGPPGAGKTMLAKALTSLLPTPTYSEIIEMTKIHSLSGSDYDKVILKRPFRSPHHSASHISLVGGGHNPKPGEISLAHRGVLCMDELPEYPRQSLESLRQPLEDRKISIARANEHVTYPADFIFIATQNPCPCGYLGDPKHSCSCTVSQIQLYKKKISGPLLDRIDMVLEVDRVETSKLLDAPNEGKTTSIFKSKVQLARNIQASRYGKAEITNSHLKGSDVNRLAKINQSTLAMLNHATTALNISARGYFKVIKVARTIADLENSTEIAESHVSEALQFRSRSNSS